MKNALQLVLAGLLSAAALTGCDQSSSAEEPVTLEAPVESGTLLSTVPISIDIGEVESPPAGDPERVETIRFHINFYVGPGGMPVTIERAVDGEVNPDPVINPANSGDLTGTIPSGFHYVYEHPVAIKPGLTQDYVVRVKITVPGADPSTDRTAEALFVVKKAATP